MVKGASGKLVLCDGQLARLVTKKINKKCAMNKMNRYFTILSSLFSSIVCFFLYDINIHKNHKYI